MSLFPRRLTQWRLLLSNYLGLSFINLLALSEMGYFIGGRCSPVGLESFWGSIWMRIECDSRVDLAGVVHILLTVALFRSCTFEQLVTGGENCKISVLRIQDFLISLRDFYAFWILMLCFLVLHIASWKGFNCYTGQKNSMADPGIKVGF